MKYKYIENKNSNKLDFDKYYTSYDDMNYCVNKTLDILQDNNLPVSCFVEPSAGNGIFSDYLYTSGKDVLAIDIVPENQDIIKGDFLTFDIPYVKNRLTIGNPPFGSKLSLARKFYKKACKIGDYVSFILPISQFNNTNFLNDFDLIYSEDLGNLTFSDSRVVHCCLNVYARPKDNHKIKKSNKLKDITIVRNDSPKFDTFECDIKMCYWGNGSAGKILNDNTKYSGVYKIKINNEKLKDKIISILSSVNWKNEINNTAMVRIKQYHIYSILKKYIPEIK